MKNARLFVMFAACAAASVAGPAWAGSERTSDASAKADVKTAKKLVKEDAQAGAALRALLSKAGVERLDQAPAPKKVVAKAVPATSISASRDRSLNYECIGIPVGSGFSPSLPAAQSQACTGICERLYGKKCRYDCFAHFNGHRQYPVGGGPCFP